jgi:hypothetical protein
MGWVFRKRIRILSGVWLNASKQLGFRLLRCFGAASRSYSIGILQGAFPRIEPAPSRSSVRTKMQ